MEAVDTSSVVNYQMNISLPQQSESVTRKKMVSVYVGDLHHDVVDDDLVWAFNEFKSLISVKVCRDYWTKEPIGYGFVNFRQLEDAAEAIRTKNHMLLKGKAVRLMWSNRVASYRKSGTGNVFVKNLDKSVDNGRLQDMFKEFGNIMSSKVAMTEDGSSKGYGFVQFDSQASADAAIKALNGKIIDGKNIYVAPFIPKPARSNPSPDASYTNLYVKNLELDTTEQQLQEIFSKFGEVSSIAIPKDEHGSSKGFGFVSFDNPDGARRAVEDMNGLPLGLKELYVGRAQTKAERQRVLRQLFEEKRQEQIQKYKDCNVYVKNIDDSVNEDMLRELFCQCGAVTSVKLMIHPKGISRGFGFVCFSTPEEAKKAIHTFHSFMFHGKPLYVAIAQRKEERQAELQKHYGQLSAGNVGLPLHPVMSVGYTPAFYPAPPAIVAPFPPQHKIIYPPPLVNFRPGWRGNGYAPPPTTRPPFHAHGQPVNGQIRGRINENALLQGHAQLSDHRKSQRNVHGRYNPNGQLPQPMPNPVDLSSFIAAADPSQQRNIIGHRLLPLVKQHQPDLANKITGMLLELDIAELLWLLDSPSSLEEKVNEAYNVLKAAKTKNSQESVRPVISAEVAVN